MSQDIVRIWVVKFGEPLLICQGYPPPNIHTVWYKKLGEGALGKTERCSYMLQELNAYGEFCKRDLVQHCTLT